MLHICAIVRDLARVHVSDPGRKGRDGQDQDVAYPDAFFRQRPQMSPSDLALGHYTQVPQDGVGEGSRTRQLDDRHDVFLVRPSRPVGVGVRWKHALSERGEGAQDPAERVEEDRMPGRR